MGLSIKDREADRLARRLAALTGESLTEAVKAALRARLEREQRRRCKPIERAKIDAIVADIAALPVVDARSLRSSSAMTTSGCPRDDRCQRIAEASVSVDALAFELPDQAHEGARLRHGRRLQRPRRLGLGRDAPARRPGAARAAAVRLRAETGAPTASPRPAGTRMRRGAGRRPSTRPITTSATEGCEARLDRSVALLSGRAMPISVRVGTTPQLSKTRRGRPRHRSQGAAPWLGSSSRSPACSRSAGRSA